MSELSDKNYRLFTWGWIFSMVATTTIPYLVSYFAAPVGHSYTWTLPPYTDDLFAYMAWTKQAAAGNLLFKLKYTAIPHSPFLLQPFFLVCGWLTALTSLTPGFIHFLVKTFGVLLFGLVFFNYLKTLRLSHRQSLLAAVIVGTTSGFGWLTTLFPAIPKSADLWIPEVNTYWSLLWNPLYPYSLLLILLFFNYLERAIRERQRHFVYLSGCTLGVMAFVHPYHVPLLYTIAITLLLLRLRRDVAPYLFGLLATSLPFVSTVYLISRFNPLAAQHTTTGLMASPPILAYLLGLGLPLIAMVCGFLLFGRVLLERFQPLILWIILGLLFCYLPFWFQRKFIFGIQLPIGILAGVAIDMAIAKISSANGRRLALVCLAGIILPLAVLTQLHNMRTTLSLFKANPTGSFYLSKELCAGMSYLGSISSTNDIVFASEPTSLLLPAFSGNSVLWGHWAMSVDAVARKQWMETTMQLQNGPETRRKFAAAGVRFIFLDGDMKRWFENTRANWLVTGAEKVFQNTDVIIYRLI